MRPRIPCFATTNNYSICYEYRVTLILIQALPLPRKPK